MVLRTGDFAPCDLNADGTCDAADIDALSLIPKSLYRSAFDLNSDRQLDFQDRRLLVNERLNTFFGDANLDGRFGSGDLTLILASAKYETDQPSTWMEGDFNGDQRTDSSDLILAYTTNAYERGPRPLAIPEPAGCVWLLIVVVHQRLRRTT